MKRVLLFCLLLILVASAGAAWLWQDMHRYIDKPLVLESDVDSFVLKRGTSFNQLLKQLETQGIINKPWYLNAYVRLNKLTGRIKAGEYRFTKGLSPRQLMDKLISGETVQHYFTVVEGTTFAQLRSMLEKRNDGVLKITLQGKGAEEILEAIGAKELHPEGLFLAETYQIERGTTDLELLKRSYQAMQRLLQQSWDNKPKGLPYQMMYDALIMASIVEKETAVAAERSKIAGVFVKRLEKGMRLQTDPTVIYGMGERYKGNITRKDLRTPTPYNTYTIAGLPPTPIALVGPDAIKAALNPERGKWLYFVAKGDGTHQFSATLKQHNRAVRQYQLKRKANYRSTPEQ